METNFKENYMAHFVEVNKWKIDVKIKLPGAIRPIFHSWKVETRKRFTCEQIVSCAMKCAFMTTEKDIHSSRRQQARVKKVIHDEIKRNA